MSRTKEICRFALDHMVIVEAAAKAVEGMTEAVFGGINGKLKDLAITRGWDFGLEDQFYGYAIPLKWRSDHRDERCHRYQFNFYPYDRPRHPLAALLRRIPGHYALFSVKFNALDMTQVLEAYDRKGSEFSKYGVGLVDNSLQIPFILDGELVLQAFEDGTLDMNSEALRPVDEAIAKLKMVHRPIRDIVDSILHHERMRV